MDPDRTMRKSLSMLVMWTYKFGKWGREEMMHRTVNASLPLPYPAKTAKLLTVASRII